MAGQAWMVSLRWAQYLDLMLLFGVPCFAWLSGGPANRLPFRATHLRASFACAAVLGIVLSVALLMAAAEAMSGADTLAAVPAGTYGDIVTGTSLGWAFQCRVVALLLMLIATVAMPITPTRFMAAAGAVALASLAWNGHGAMDDGVRGDVHLAVDIAHMWAAGAWLGALLVFLAAAVGPRSDDRTALVWLAHATRGFATLGTAIVVVLAVTGLANYGMIAGMAWQPLVATRYGNLLLVKLALFALMLGLASLNRYRLSPRLHAAMTGHDVSSAVRHLRVSLGLEAGLAVAVIGLVAWLGTLAPDP